MASNKNSEIRKLLKKHKLFMYEGAIACGVSDYTFSRWLHRELSKEKKSEIMEAIEKYVTERG